MSFSTEANLEGNECQKGSSSSSNNKRFKSTRGKLGLCLCVRENWVSNVWRMCASVGWRKSCKREGRWEAVRRAAEKFSEKRLQRVRRRHYCCEKARAAIIRGSVEVNEATLTWEGQGDRSYKKTHTHTHSFLTPSHPSRLSSARCARRTHK